MLIALAGDIFVSRSPTGLLGKLIRRFTRRPGDPAWSNHAGIFVKSGAIAPDGEAAFEGLCQAEIVEARLRVWRGPFYDAYGPHLGEKQPEVIIYRPIRLPSAARSRIAAAAEAYVGRRYGFQGLLWHALDTWLTKAGLLGGRDVYLFRRLNWWRNVECSTLDKRAYEAGTTDENYRNFGLPKGARANPDDIEDFCREHPRLWQRVCGPGKIGA